MSAAAAMPAGASMEAGMPVTYMAQAPVGAPVVYAAAPQVVTYAAAPQQVVYASPTVMDAGQGQVTYLTAGAPMVMEGGAQMVYAADPGQGQVMYGADPGQVTYLTAPAGEDGQVLQEGQVQYVMEGAQMTYGAPQVVMEGGQMAYAAPPPMVMAAPARVNVSAEIFQKLASGIPLTVEEQAQLTGEPAPAGGLAGAADSALAAAGSVASTGAGMLVGGAAAAGAAAAAVGEAVAPSSAKASSKKKDKKEKTGSKKALKASKKKKNSGCC